MKQNKPTGFGQRILELVQKWRAGILEESENQELSAWFYALEERELGSPVELTVDLVEKRLHEQLYVNKNNESENKADAPPHPWHNKNTDKKI